MEKVSVEKFLQHRKEAFIVFLSCIVPQKFSVLFVLCKVFIFVSVIKLTKSYFADTTVAVYASILSFRIATALLFQMRIIAFFTFINFSFVNGKFISRKEFFFVKKEIYNKISFRVLVAIGGHQTHKFHHARRFI